MIRRAAPGDLPSLVALEAALFGDDAWVESQLRAELSGPGRCFQVNDDEVNGAGGGVIGGDDVGGVIAYVVTRVVADTADLLRIGVRPDRRRSGAGTAILAAAMREAQHAGATRMLLEVGTDNLAALALYGAADFAEIDRRPRYYRSGADALVLAREL